MFGRKKRFTFVATFAVALIAVGCASLSESDCREGNWGNIGIRDGQNGRPMSYFKKHVEACSEYGINPNIANYKAGRKNGLKRYCVPDIGYNEGSKGYTYHDVCPAHLETAFLKAYRAGKEVYRLERKIRYIDEEIIRLEGKLDVAESSWERRSIRRDIRRQERRRAELQRKMTVLEVRGVRRGD